ncbi:MAG: hypothetical protein SYC29_05715 [Planctomycetota bacterium]|nr:hypothetical protein [Planctomycetota bacterium]
MHIDRQTIRQLIQHRHEPCVSLYLPLEDGGDGSQQDVIRLRNLLREAERQLAGRGLSDRAIAQRLEPARRRLDGRQLARHGGAALALLCGDREHAFKLPYDVPAFAWCGERFHVKPLFAVTDAPPTVYVLALSQRRVDLYRVDDDHVEPVTLPDAPNDFADAMRFDDPQRQLQYHSGAPPRGGGQRDAIFHGHGTAADDAEQKKRLLEYCRMIDTAVVSRLRDDRAPLMLAAAEPIQSIYRTANSHRRLLNATLEGNPDELRPDELRRRVRAHIRGTGPEALAEEVEQFHAAVPRRLASRDLETILAAATQGQVRTLFVSLHDQVWGRFEAASGSIRLHEQREPTDEDLLDAAVAHCAATGGRVFAAEARTLPDGLAASAVLRSAAVSDGA